MEAARLSGKAIKALLDDLRIPYTLQSHGVPREAITEIARSTMGAARVLGNTPRSVSEESVVELLHANYGD